MKKTNLVNLMQRYVTGQVSEQEKEKIEAWLDLKKTEGADLELGEEDEERLFEKITANIDNIDEIRAFRPARAEHKSNAATRFRSSWLKAAAVLLILVAASALLWKLAIENNVYEIATTTVPQKTILSDGTIVWLKESSRLTYVEREGLRLASLQGEGLFEVAKDPSSPFFISCGDLEVRVVGTSFNLKTDSSATELKVLTGKVQLTSPDNPAGIEVIRNEMAIYADGQIRKVAVTPREVMKVAAGTEYDMKFRNVSLSDVARKIENKFDVKITFDDPHAGDCRITADFTDHSLESTLRMITELLEINYRINQRDVVIAGNGCQ